MEDEGADAAGDRPATTGRTTDAAGEGQGPASGGSDGERGSPTAAGLRPEEADREPDAVSTRPDAPDLRPDAADRPPDAAHLLPNWASRRRFVAKAAVAGLAAVGLAGVLGPAQADPDPPADRYVDRSDLEHGAGLDDGSGRLRGGVPVARWQYKLTRDGFRPTSPINVAVALGPDRTLADAMDVFAADRWHVRPEEYVRYVRSPAGEWEPVHAAATESLFGTARRFHVRCWAFDGVVSIQAHEDTVPSPGHAVASYRTGRERVERLFASAGWRVAPGALAAGNDKDPDHDGRLTVIEP